MSFPHRTDREIDPILAAKCEAFTLMLAATENRGEWTAHQFADGSAARLARQTCEHEGRFEVRAADPKFPSTVAIRSKRA
jgi:hypothetical protein